MVSYSKDLGIFLHFWEKDLGIFRQFREKDLGIFGFLLSPSNHNGSTGI